VDQGYFEAGWVMKTLILGSDSIDTSKAYLKFNLPESTLVCNVDQSYTVGHTSRQEFSTDLELEKVLSSADSVYWASIAADEFGNKDMYYTFLEWLKAYQLKYNNIVNFDKTQAIDPYNWLPTMPVTTNNDIIFFGSSTTAGAGLSSREQRYTSIVAKHFNKNVINFPELFSNSDSINNNDKSVRLFSLTDFVPGQIVVFHVAPLWRFRYCTNDNVLVDRALHDGRGLENHKHIIEVYTKQFLFYQLTVNIELIVKIARANKLKFVFLLDDYKDPDSITYEDQMYFYKFPEYIPCTSLENEIYIDFGTDKKHPGTLANKLIAERIIEHIERIYP
jgi:hypothetical protein